jgi:hypothetical protein
MINLIIIFIYFFFLRLLVQILYPTYKDSDTFFHLFFINFIRKYKRIVYYEEKKFIRPSNFYYPWLTHKLLSYFPKKYDGFFIQKLLNPFLELVYIYLLYFLTLYLIKSSDISLILVLVYLSLPITFTVQSLGPRIHSFTPRLFGEIIGSLVFISEYLYFETYNYIYIILASLFVAIVISSSRFSLQAILFISIIAYIFTYNIELLIPIFLGIGIFLLLYRQHGIKLLQSHLNHIITFCKNHWENKSYISGNNTLTLFVKSIKSKSLIQIYTYFIYQNTFTSLLIKAPIIILFLYLTIFEYNIKNFQYIIAISGIIVFIIISFKPLLFLGEPERYVNHVLFFILISCAQYLATHIWLFFLFIFYGIFFLILDLIYISKYLSKQYAPSIIKRLNKFNESLNVMSIPINLSGSWRIIYETKHNLLHPVQWNNPNDRERFRSFLLKYETIDLNKIDEIVQEYHLDIIIIYKKLLQRSFKNRLKIPPGYILEDFDNDIYILLKEGI